MSGVDRPDASPPREHLSALAALVDAETAEETRRLADRLDRLQRICRQLTAAVTADDVVRTVMDVLDTPETASTRGLWLLDSGSEALRLVAQSGMAPDAASAFEVIPLDSDLPGAIAYRDRVTVGSQTIEDTGERFPTLRAVERSTDGFLAIPLAVHTTCEGVLAFGSHGELTRAEVTFLEAVAGHVAQTLARVRLAEEAQLRALDAMTVADIERRRREQLEFLSSLTTTALVADDHTTLMHRVAQAAVPTLGDWCSVNFLPTGAPSPEVAVAHVDPERVAWAEALATQFPFDPEASTGIPAVLRSGRTEFIPLVTQDVIDAAIPGQSIPPDIAQTIVDMLGLTSVITAPMRTKRGVIGAIQFVSAESGRRYDADDVVLAEAAASRVAESLENMWFADQHRHISLTLQRSLLPPRLPDIEGVDVAARYVPAGALTEIGGDFYDVFDANDGSWAVLVGDACGTGPDAAALTTIARHSVRDAVMHGDTHHEVMHWLNHAMLHSQRDLFCTACLATLRCVDSRWTLQTTAAGHPLPIRTSGGTSTQLGRYGTLLGVFDDVEVTTAETDLEPGDVVVFYTDGVTDLPPPYGATPIEVMQLVQELPADKSADDIADRLLDAVSGRVPEANRVDDIALVVLKV